MTCLIKYVFQIKLIIEHAEHDYENKSIENNNKAYIMQM